MFEITSLEDIEALRESADVECKLAQGRDGSGALPKDIWETYSAFANTAGGDIFLGLKELKGGRFELAGIDKPERVLDDLWSTIDNKQAVSANVLREQWVSQIVIAGKTIIHVHVPQATRKQRPVFIRGNPLTGTYKRQNSSDIRLGEEDVRRLLAEQVEDSRDSAILNGFGFEDIDTEAINTYRNMYSARQPDHPWNKLDAQDFLYQIGAWGKDRESGRTGLTRAGLLMFGTYRPIMEAFPNYMVDYRERPEPKKETRWVDRLVPDGSWSGNLFDFYQKVIRKLTSELKVPFVLKGDTRQDDTLVHKALREALVNCLVHADYTGRSSVLVVKRPDMFGFRNPGNMRVPVETALNGGSSDCRNRNLQNMFRFIGLGENAGSGLPKIFDGWSSQHWRQPILKEVQSPSEQTLLELHMLSLVPESSIRELQEQLGAATFNELTEDERLILVTAHIENTVDHARLMDILNIHPRDLTATLAKLVSQKLLWQDGSGRGTVYFTAEARMNDAFQEFAASSASEMLRSGGSDLSSGGKEVSSGGSGLLNSIAAPIANVKRASKLGVEEIILKLCAVQPLKQDELGALLNRNGEFLRKSYLQSLIKARKLKLLYPTKPQHPDQAYITEEGNE